MEPMSIIAIISLVMSVVMTAGEVAAQEHANKENINNQHQLLNQQQQFAKESAAEANRVTEEQYMTLYSPAAKVRQLKEAGLSPGLMYGGAGPGGAGTTAAQAATPSPTSAMINPLLQSGQMNNVMNALKTITEAKKTEKEAKRVNYEINNLIATTKKTEEEAKTNVVTRNFTETQNKIAQLQLTFETEKYAVRCEILDEELNTLKANVSKTKEDIRTAEIENKYRPQLYESTLQLNEETRKKIINEQGVLLAEEALKKAQKDLTEAQTRKEEEETNRIKKDIERLQYILDEYEKWGYKATETDNWQMELINLIKHYIPDEEKGVLEEIRKKGIWKWLKEKDEQLSKDYTKDNPNEHGGGGRW